MSSGARAQPNAFWVIDTIYVPLPPFIGPVAYRHAIDLNTCSQSTNPVLFDAFFSIYGDYLDLTLPQMNSSFFTSGPGDAVPDHVLGMSIPPMYNPASGPAFAPEIYPRAIASWYDNRIFFAGQGISYYTPATTASRYLGDLPLFFQPEGPMTLREGSFYYPNLGRQLVQLRVVGDTFYHRLLPAILPDTMNYGGILTIPHRCDSLVTYIIHRGASWGSRLFVLDVSDGTLTPRCPDFMYKMVTAAHRGENVTPPGCEPEFRLDLLASSGTADRYDTICRGPHYLFDERSVLGASAAIDSIVLELLDTPDGLQESLEAPNLSALQISPAGSGSSLLRLRCAGFPDTEAFREALRQVQYRHTAVAPTEGLRRIRFTIYYPHLPVQTATYYLSLSNEALRTNAALTPPRCYGGQDGTISLNPSGGSPAYQLSWADGATGTVRSQLAAGVYELTLTDANGCRREQQLVLEQPDSLQLSLSALQDTLCAATGQLTAIPAGGLPPYTYTWSHGPMGSPATGLAAGHYQLTVYDAQLCEATAQYTLYPRDTIRQSVTYTGCQGDVYTDSGWYLTRDTSFAQYYPTASGCDSVFSLQLSFADTFNLTETLAICQGQSVEVGGLSFFQDTVLNLRLTSVAGCDSLRTVIVAVAENEQLETDYFCAGEVYVWNGRSLSEPGLYRDTFALGGGCDSIVLLELVQRVPPEVAIVEQGSLCGQGEVLLAASAPAAQYHWSTGDTGPSITVSAPGGYALTVTDGFGCQGSTTVQVDAGGFTPYFRLLAPTCAGQAASVLIDSVRGDYPPFVLSIDGRSLSVPGRIDNLAPGLYEALMTDATGCQQAFSWDLSLQSPGTLYLPASLELNWGDTLLLQPQTNFVPAQAQWTPPLGLSNPDSVLTRAFPLDSERYRLRLLDASGCSYEAEVVVLVRRPAPFYAPTAFSPNDDGVNDAFELFPGPGVEIWHFSVYNRWGARLADQNGVPLSAPELRWSGKDQPPGIYVYRLRYRLADGHEGEAAGEVLLVR